MSAASGAPAEGRIVAEGDVPQVEPTLRYFAELRASLKNALDVERELRAAEFASVAELAQAWGELATARAAQRRLMFAEGLLEDHGLLASLDQLCEEDDVEARGQAMEP